MSQAAEEFWNEIVGPDGELWYQSSDEAFRPIDKSKFIEKYDNMNGPGKYKKDSVVCPKCSNVVFRGNWCCGEYRPRENTKEQSDA